MYPTIPGRDTEPQEDRSNREGNIHRVDTNTGAKLVRNFRTSQFDENDMKYAFCPTLLEKYEYFRTNARTKAGVSAETPAHYYNTYAREDYLLSDRLSLLPG